MNTETLDQAGLATETAVADRRRSDRKVRLVPGWLSDSASGGVMRQQQQVTVTNLSLEGVGFHAPKLLHRGDAHWLVVSANALHLSTRCRIVTVRPRADGSCDVGAEFF